MEDLKALMPSMELETILNRMNLKTSTSPIDTTFYLTDSINVVLGLLEGAMSAIPSNTQNYYCSKNVTLARGYLTTMITDFSLGENDDGMTYLNSLLTKTDDIYQNCYLAVSSTASVPTDMASLVSADSPILLNILYNLGYQFTDVLDLIFYDPTNTDPYWFYVSFRLGDFFIRFIYRDETA